MATAVGSLAQGGGDARSGIPLVTSAEAASLNEGGGHPTTGIRLIPDTTSSNAGGGDAVTVGIRVAIAGETELVGTPFPAFPSSTTGSTSHGGGASSTSGTVAFISINEGGGDAITLGEKPGSVASTNPGGGDAITSGSRVSPAVSTNAGGGDATSTIALLHSGASLNEGGGDATTRVATAAGAVTITLAATLKYTLVLEAEPK